MRVSGGLLFAWEPGMHVGGRGNFVVHPGQVVVETNHLVKQMFLSKL